MSKNAYEIRIEMLRRRLGQVQEELAVIEKEKWKFERELKYTDKNALRLKREKAGSIIEAAGLLDNYDLDKLLMFLKWHRNEIVFD